MRRRAGAGSGWSAKEEEKAAAANAEGELIFVRRRRRRRPGELIVIRGMPRGASDCASFPDEEDPEADLNALWPEI